MSGREYLTLLLGLLLTCQQCAAQGGYNYVRPEVAVGGGNVASGKAANNPLRPLVAGYSPAATGATAYPTAATAYGGGSGRGNVAPAAAYAGYGGQAQRGGLAAAGFVPTAATAAGGFAGAAAGLPQRPTLPQRTAVGIYGAGALPAQPQYAGTARGSGGTAAGGEDDEGDYSAIPGAPGVDYPIYGQVPQTNFDCAQQPLPGYYSDVEALCQVFHICALNRTYSFLCPNGTVFSQETLVCVWWNQYDCASAPSLYANNAFIYDYGAEGIPSNAGLRSAAAAIGIGGGGARTQPSYAAGGSGRTPSGIFGAGNIRGGGIGGGSYPSVSPTVPTGGYAAGVSPNSLVGRYTPTPTGAAQAFPALGSVATPAPFGAVIRGGGAANNAAAGGGGGLPEAAYANAQVPTSSTNREYLPPRRP